MHETEDWKSPITGKVYKIRKDLTFGESNRILDESTDIDMKTGNVMIKAEKNRAKMIVLAVVEPKMTEKDASELPMVEGARLYTQITVLNNVPLGTSPDSSLSTEEKEEPPKSA